jgi:hypothetical protein
MDERRCRFCQNSFRPSKFQPGQQVCSPPDCQRKRRSEYHKAKIAADPVYREVCQDSTRKWRAHNPGYWKQYRQQHPAAAEQNRRQQQFRDRKRRLRHLANNTSALDLKHSAAQIWLVGAGATQLANNTSAPAQIWVIEVLPPPLPLRRPLANNNLLVLPPHLPDKETRRC